jgi:hypothetical protein
MWHFPTIRIRLKVKSGWHGAFFKGWKKEVLIHCWWKHQSVSTLSAVWLKFKCTHSLPHQLPGPEFTQRSLSWRMARHASDILLSLYREKTQKWPTCPPKKKWLTWYIHILESHGALKTWAISKCTDMERCYITILWTELCLPHPLLNSYIEVQTQSLRLGVFGYRIFKEVVKVKWGQNRVGPFPIWLVYL